MSRPMIRLILLGAPASGKGTLAKRVMQESDLLHVSLGDILRLHIMQDTMLGRCISPFVKRGQLAPDHLVVQCVLDRLAQLAETQESWILDGFPRTLMQAKRLHQFIPTVDAVFHAIVPDAIIIERAENRWTHLPSGRVYNKDYNEPKIKWKDDITGEELVRRLDDQPKLLRQRLQLHHKAIPAILDFYRSHKITVIQLDGATTDYNWKRVDTFVKAIQAKQAKAAD